jgi:hypothetical protein
MAVRNQLSQLCDLKIITLGGTHKTSAQLFSGQNAAAAVNQVRRRYCSTVVCTYEVHWRLVEECRCTV